MSFEIGLATLLVGFILGWQAKRDWEQHEPPER